MEKYNEKLKMVGWSMASRVWDITQRADLEKVAGEIVDMVHGGAAPGRAAVLALSGDLGAGKTTFTQLLARRLGVHESVTSPTFVIMKQYETTDTRFPRLVHIDAYRLNSSEELQVLGFASWLTEPNTLICIEWAEKVIDLLPEHTIRLRFDLSGDTRSLTVT